MSVQLYQDVTFTVDEGGVPVNKVVGRFTMKLGCKRGSRVAMNRVKFQLYANTFDELLIEAAELAEQIDRWSEGQLMGMDMTLGHYVKDELIPAEPQRSTHAFILNRSREDRKRVSTVKIPWMKTSITPQQVETFFSDHPSLCSIQLLPDGITPHMEPCPEFRHLTYKDTLAEDDYIVDSGDVKDDAGADGKVDGLA